MYKVDLNSDIGESFGAYKMGDDSAIMNAVTSANVACGFHAGDPLVYQINRQNHIKQGQQKDRHTKQDIHIEIFENLPYRIVGMNFTSRQPISQVGQATENNRTDK